MTPETVAAVKYHAALQFSVAEVEAILDLDPGTIQKDREAERAYMAGNLLAQAVARKKLYDLVQDGDRAASIAFIRMAERSGMVLVDEE